MFWMLTVEIDKWYSKKGNKNEQISLWIELP